MLAYWIGVIAGIAAGVMMMLNSPSGVSPEGVVAVVAASVGAAVLVWLVLKRVVSS